MRGTQNELNKNQNKTKSFLLLIFFLLLNITQAVYSINPILEEHTGAGGWIIDNANLLSEDLRWKLNGLISDVEQSTQAELLVVTTDMYTVETIGNIPVEIYTEWGVGKNGSETGVLLMVLSTDKGVVIVSVDSYLSPKFRQRVIDQIMSPALKAGKNEEAFLVGIYTILQEMEKPYLKSSKSSVLSPDFLGQNKELIGDLAKKEVDTVDFSSFVILLGLLSLLFLVVAFGQTVSYVKQNKILRPGVNQIEKQKGLWLWLGIGGAGMILLILVLFLKEERILDHLFVFVIGSAIGGFLLGYLFEEHIFEGTRSFRTYQCVHCQFGLYEVAPSEDLYKNVLLPQQLTELTIGSALYEVYVCTNQDCFLFSAQKEKQHIIDEIESLVEEDLSADDNTDNNNLSKLEKKQKKLFIVRRETDAMFWVCPNCKSRTSKIPSQDERLSSQMSTSKRPNENSVQLYCCHCNTSSPLPHPDSLQSSALYVNPLGTRSRMYKLYKDKKENKQHQQRILHCRECKSTLRCRIYINSKNSHFLENYYVPTQAEEIALSLGYIDISFWYCESCSPALPTTSSDTPPNSPSLNRRTGLKPKYHMLVLANPFVFECVDCKELTLQPAYQSSQYDDENFMDYKCLSCGQILPFPRQPF